MNNRIALIPIDCRPVTYNLPIDLANIINCEILVPPKEKLGYLREPADPNYILDWIEETLPNVNGIIVSADMVLYGGLIPSRINNESTSVIESRIQKLMKLRKKFPKVKFMIFSSILRLSNNYVNDEEKLYWDKYGKEIYKYSYYVHKNQRSYSEENEKTIEEMLRIVPNDILADYMNTRKRNFEINFSLLNFVEQGFIDLLVYPQDDTSEYGMNVIEREKLHEEVVKLELSEQVLIYPGADEVASILCARMIYELENKRIPQFYPVYSGQKGAMSIAMYEDRPISESLKAQIIALGSTLAQDKGTSDILLGVNVPGESQGDLALQINLENVNTKDRDTEKWVNELSYAYQEGKRIAIADVAYANGADISVIPSLFNKINPLNLYGFAAWNTAANTIGTVIAQASISYLAEKLNKTNVVAKNDALVTRVLDDYYYQSVFRQQLRKVMNDESYIAENISEIEKSFIENSTHLLESMGFKQSVEKIYFPWNRSFEIGLNIKEEKE